MSRNRFRDDVAALFKAYPNQWIDGLVIATVGGVYASRTRISECRTQLDMRIQNRVRTKANGVRVSEYKFTPTLPSQPSFEMGAGR